MPTYFVYCRKSSEPAPADSCRTSVRFAAGRYPISNSPHSWQRRAGDVRKPVKKELAKDPEIAQHHPQIVMQIRKQKKLELQKEMVDIAYNVTRGAFELFQDAVAFLSGSHCHLPNTGVVAFLELFHPERSEVGGYQ
jgi:hypothetical protein